MKLSEEIPMHFLCAYGKVTELIKSIRILLELITGLLNQMTEEVPNCYKETDVGYSAFLMKVLQFDFIWILSVMRIIMRRCKILIA